MGLKDIQLSDHYRTDKCNIVDAFYVPCLREAKVYYRAVGFFSSSALSIAAKGLPQFIQHNGHMSLVASPILSKRDIEEISQGYEIRDKILASRLDHSLEQTGSSIVNERLGYLAWLISVGRLDIRIALANDGGIYHEKLGIFIDENDDYVAFSGSPNESSSGLSSNFESIDVFCSWHDHDQARANRKIVEFENLWQNNTNNLSVISFPEASKKKLLAFRPDAPPRKDPEEGIIQRDQSNNKIHLRSYQTQAIASWFGNGGKGIFSMATGSGKTYSAIAAFINGVSKYKLKGCLIIAPYRHLVRQWEKNVREFKLDPIICMESSYSWQAELFSKLFATNSEPLVIITTNSTLATKSFQSALPHLTKKFMIIGDEVHNLGAEVNFSSLPKAPAFRLGLSATPVRHFDEEGSSKIVNYFGPVLQPEFTMEDALTEGVLTPYNYFPVLVSLSEEELSQYFELSKQISKHFAQMTGNYTDQAPLPSGTKSLLIKRARLIGTAQNKLVQLKSIFQSNNKVGKFIVYCGDGTTESPLSGELNRHIDQATYLLGRQLSLRVAKYTADTPTQERERLANLLSSNQINGLISIRCLDEGVDIPSVDTAFLLASSTNPRQYIQRRGRVLRKAPNKNSANIYDFLIDPTQSTKTNEYREVERNLFKKELVRVREFANLAQNKFQALEKINPILDSLNLLDQ